MEILVKIKNVYGNDTIYPVCPKAILFAELAQTKTLTSGTLSRIKALGYTIKLLQKETI